MPLHAHLLVTVCSTSGIELKLRGASPCAIVRCPLQASAHLPTRAGRRPAARERREQLGRPGEAHGGPERRTHWGQQRGHGASNSHRGSSSSSRPAVAEASRGRCAEPGAGGSLPRSAGTPPSLKAPAVCQLQLLPPPQPALCGGAGGPLRWCSLRRRASCSRGVPRARRCALLGLSAKPCGLRRS